MQSGRINGPSYFSPDRNKAKTYGDDVVEVNVPKTALKIDLDLPGGKLLSVEEANGYLDNPDWNLDDYLGRGFSVGVEQSVQVK